MGHAPNDLRNERKLRDFDARRRSETLAGWRRESGRLEAVRTIGGCLARGAVLTGKCERRGDCRRRVTIDLRFWSDHGFGEMEHSALVQQYRCGRLGGCGMGFEESYPGGVPLVWLAEPPDHSVEFFCQACRRRGYHARASAMLGDLRRLGRPDADRVGIVTIAARLRIRCPCAPQRPATWFARAEGCKPPNPSTA